MNDLIKKLNVLLKANLIPDDLELKLPRLGKTVEGDIASLRKRINEAVGYEDEIKGRIRQLEDEAAQWDRQADDAVARGDDASARRAIEQMRRAEQRAAMTQADLREHQRATQDLIQRVNMLDAVAADARREQADAAAQTPDLGGVLREAREKIASLTDTSAAQQEVNPPAAHQDDAAEIDDDLERRRQRLSK